MEDTITITKQEYFELRLAEETLELLLAGGGVDNWNGYGNSLWPSDEEDIGEVATRLRQEIFN